MQLIQPSAKAVAAFTVSVQRLTCSKGRLLLAVSGGPDSIAMLLLAQAAMPSIVNAATVDHGLRPEAADEAQFVHNLCAQIGIPHHILRPAHPITGSLQAQARTARYALLTAHAETSGCDWIATAHHADDQLETLLMRIARGSGVDGLAAVRERQGQIIRPMLEFRKTELEAICAECAVMPVQDPSNRDDRFDRVAIRQWLAKADHPFDTLRSVRTARACADASAALNWSTDQLYKTQVRQDEGHILLETGAIPRELLRRLCIRIIGSIQPGYMPRGEMLDEAMHALAKGEKRMLGNVMCEGGEIWRFYLAPQRQH